jgi:hypothetical protein
VTSGCGCSTVAGERRWPKASRPGAMEPRETERPWPHRLLVRLLTGRRPTPEPSPHCRLQASSWVASSISGPTSVALSEGSLADVSALPVATSQRSRPRPLDGRLTVVRPTPVPTSLRPPARRLSVIWPAPRRRLVVASRTSAPSPCRLLDRRLTVALPSPEPTSHRAPRRRLGGHLSVLRTVSGPSPHGSSAVASWSSHGLLGRRLPDFSAVDSPTSGRGGSRAFLGLLGVILRFVSPTSERLSRRPPAGICPTLWPSPHRLPSDA